MAPTEHDPTALAKEWADRDKTVWLCASEARDLADGYLTQKDRAEHAEARAATLTAERDAIREVLNADLRTAQERVLTLELESQRLGPPVPACPQCGCQRLTNSSQWKGDSRRYPMPSGQPWQSYYCEACDHTFTEPTCDRQVKGPA